jgi:signal transduction histidine kinase
VKLPALLIDANLSVVLGILAQVDTTASVVNLDASVVTAVQPVGACILACAAHKARANGKELVVAQWSPQFRQLMQRLACEVTWGDQQPQVRSGEERPQAPTLVTPIMSRENGNAVANDLSTQITAFIPTEDRSGVLEDERSELAYHLVQPVLAYALGELVDNVFSHARRSTEAIGSWGAAQWYPTGDLVRVAIVDTGCGLLASLRDYHSPPKNHFEAAALAFKPFVSSKGDIGMYADRSHMGLGLPVCRDICERLGGRLYAASGNAWVTNPGLSSEERHSLAVPHAGTTVSLEFHRRAITSRTMQEILAKYTGKPTDLRPQFKP